MSLLVLAENTQEIDDESVKIDQIDPLGDGATNQTIVETDSIQVRDESTANDKDNALNANDAASDTVHEYGANEVDGYNEDNDIFSWSLTNISVQSASNDDSNAYALPKTVYDMKKNMNFVTATTSTPIHVNPLGSQIQAPQDATAEILSPALNNMCIELKGEKSPINEKDLMAVESILNASYENVNSSDDDVLIHKDEYIPRPISNMVNLQIKWTNGFQLGRFQRIIVSRQAFHKDFNGLMHRSTTS